MERIRTDLDAYAAEGTAPLERLLAALRDGEDPAPALDALHEALLAAGDAVGVHGGGGTRGMTPLGVDPATPDEWVLICPTRQCSRHAWPDASEAPRCRVSGQPLRRERL
ncbi:hypothetical protein GCM10009730_44970 [Streptomyces albidochromogenes]